MRFKKLRIAVGISIVLFIFIAGTIILLGTKSNQTQNSANNLAPVTNKALTNNPSTNPNTQTNTQPQTQQPQNYQPPVVYHPVMMTGAS